MKETKEKIKILSDNTVITLDNIEKLSKCLALSAVKGFKKYSFYFIQKVEQLHKQLQYDICYHKPLENYSNAYDLVQEASLFLCSYIGNKLGDICVTSKSRFGVIDTIKSACLRKLQVYLRKEFKYENNTTNEEEYLEIAIEKPIFKEKQDYSEVKQIAKQLVKTKLEAQIFQYFFDGVTPKLVAEFLQISTDKVYKRRRKFKDRYKMYIA